MLYFLYSLKDTYVVLNIFKYITFRAFGAGVTAFLISIFLGGLMIRFLSNRQLKESIREFGPPTHKTKEGTPTMGGGFIIIAICISTVLWVNLSSALTWFVLICTFAYASIGFTDDWLKLTSGSGMRVKVKFLLQVSTALVLILILLMFKENFTMSLRVGETGSYSFTSIVFPFFKNAVIDLGWLYIPFAVILVVGSSNAVNLTDGLDGLVIVPIAIASATYLIFAYLSGHSEFARYLQIPYIKGSGELAVFLAALGGASLGFLWYNSHPAQVFMGDVGSLGLGAAIGSVAIIIKQEILLVLVGGLFVAEALSVIIQVASFKLTGKRVFRMAPLHHHFELSGWSESKVVIRFWIVSLVLALMALATLKLR
ncbi:MAG: phospho-N-acetylmuramoyl-pentapeptide-transferase [Thermodesulfobacteriota bacterium]